MSQWWVAMAQAVAMGARLLISYDSITVALALSHENNGRTSEEREWGNVFSRASYGSGKRLYCHSSLSRVTGSK